MSDQDHEPSPSIHPEARALYEGTRGMTMKGVAEATGLPLKELNRVSASENWRKKQVTKFGGATPLAAAAAERIAENLKKAPVQETHNQVSEEQVGALASNVTIESRGDVLERHLRELGVVRALIVEAVKLRNSNAIMSFERAKLARTVVEAMGAVHDGERRALGITEKDKAPKAPDGPAGFVLLERTEGAEDVG